MIARKRCVSAAVDLAALGTACVSAAVGCFAGAGWGWLAEGLSLLALAGMCLVAGAGADE